MTPYNFYPMYHNWNILPEHLLQRFSSSRVAGAWSVEPFPWTGMLMGMTYPPSDMELLRLAFPRRVFTLSQTNFLLDRLKWLHENRELIGGLKFTEEPAVLRFFMGRLEAVSDWPEKLVARFKADFGDSL